jgi:LPXTG-motif cell wall-anchored protein
MSSWFTDDVIQASDIFILLGLLALSIWGAVYLRRRNR